MKFKRFNNFPDLTFGGDHYLKAFKNGYSVSIIRHRYSYGGNKGLYELALYHAGSMIFEDEILGYYPKGHLSPQEVDEICERIRLLPRTYKYSKIPRKLKKQFKSAIIIQGYMYFNGMKPRSRKIRIFTIAPSGIRKELPGHIRVGSLTVKSFDILS